MLAQSSLRSSQLRQKAAHSRPAISAVPRSQRVAQPRVVANAGKVWIPHQSSIAWTACLLVSSFLWRHLVGCCCRRNNAPRPLLLRLPPLLRIPRRTKRALCIPNQVQKVTPEELEVAIANRDKAILVDFFGERRSG